MKSILAVLGFILLTCSAVLIYTSYREYVNPAKVYGSWVETQVMQDRREVITFSENGVFRNDHLITTKFKFDGKRIRFSAGSGKTVYQLSGNEQSPQLKRIEPNQPIQIMIKAGYEHTLEKPSNVLRHLNTRSSFVEGFSPE